MVYPSQAVSVPFITNIGVGHLTIRCRLCYVKHHAANIGTSPQVVSVLSRSQLLQDNLRLMVSMKTPFLFQKLRSVRRLSVVVPHNASKVLCRSSCQNKHRDRKKPSKDRVHLLRAQLRRFQCHSGSAMACPPLPPAVCCAFPYPIAILLLGWFLREYAVHSRLPIQQILFAPFVNGVCAFLSLEG